MQKYTSAIRNKKIIICGTNVHPGEVANLALPLPEQYSCAPLYMPIKVIRGKWQGPCLVIFSVLKGIELNGLEIANRIIQDLNTEEICGTIISIPVMNVFGLTHYPSTLPHGADLAMCFPGNPRGSYGERIAYIVTEEILKKANYCIELQTGGLHHNILPQVYCNFDNQNTKKLAKDFNTPVVSNVTLEGNTLRQTTEELQIPLLVYQAGEAMRFDQNAINLGIEGVKNVMQSIGILAVSNRISDKGAIFSRSENWMLAHKGGIMRPIAALGQKVNVGEVIGSFHDPFSSDISESIKASHNGIIVGINTAPIIHEGSPVFKIASFLDYEKAEAVIMDWEQQVNN